MEPRWRFNAKVAPPWLVHATHEKTGLLGLGRRAMAVNKLVGLFRGGLLGGGGGGLGAQAAGTAGNSAAVSSGEVPLPAGALPPAVRRSPRSVGPASGDPSAALPSPALGSGEAAGRSLFRALTTNAGKRGGVQP
jgi:hypothetical protein